jgi:aromatic-L-amino-acid decarboxylase
MTIRDNWLAQSTQWVSDYLSRVPELPVLAQIKPGAVRSALPPHPPEGPTSWAEVRADLDRILLPGMTHWNHPRFFGYFANSSPPPAIAGELIAAATNQNSMLWRTSPAASELEEVTTRWLAQLLGLPPWFAIMHDTASTSTFSALAAARHRVAPVTSEEGLAGSPPLTVYASEEAHSSVAKAVMALGLGRQGLRQVATDEMARMDPTALEAAIEADQAAGALPTAVVATVGTTAATAVDPLPALAEICQTHGLWLHVDAAYGGAAAASPSRRWVLEGSCEADSVVVNPHKWLFVPVDCSILYLRDPAATRAAFSLVPEYLQATEEATNQMDYSLALGRRWRSLKLWMVMRAMGTSGIVAAIEEHMRLARLLASWVEEEGGFEVLAPVNFAVVNFRWAPPGLEGRALDRANRELAERANRTGRAFLTVAPVRGATALHASIGNLETREEDVRALWDAVRGEAKRLSVPLAPSDH